MTGTDAFAEFKLRNRFNKGHRWFMLEAVTNTKSLCNGTVRLILVSSDSIKIDLIPLFDIAEGCSHDTVCTPHSFKLSST